MVRSVFISAALSVSLSALAQTNANPVELSGIKFEQRIELGGKPLQLNGAGIRYRAIFKVYAAGLYLSQKASTPEEVLQSPGPKRMHMVLLRAIDAREFGRILSEGLERNATRQEFIHALPAVQAMGEAASAIKQLVPGDTMGVEFVPELGTTLLVKGKPFYGPYKDPALFAAMMKIWLGQQPADAQLKQALLGQQRAPRAR